MSKIQIKLEPIPFKQFAKANSISFKVIQDGKVVMKGNAPSSSWALGRIKGFLGK